MLFNMSGAFSVLLFAILFASVIIFPGSCYITNQTEILYDNMDENVNHTLNVTEYCGCDCPEGHEEVGPGYYTYHIQCAMYKILNTLGLTIIPILSMIFLLATLILYALLPKSTPYGKALMFYVFTVFLSYVFGFPIQQYQDKFGGNGLCKLIGYCVLFLDMASVFWMNVMCFEVWSFFSFIRQRNAERKRILLYCTYAYGTPAIIATIVMLLNECMDRTSEYYPGIGEENCFLKDGMPYLVYYYGPMIVIVMFNVVLFILTTRRIKKIKSSSSMFTLYLRLFFVMGVDWTIEVIYWIVTWKMGNDMNTYLRYFMYFWVLFGTSSSNGIFIFFIFVFKKEVWMCLKNRYYWRKSTESIETMSI